jgi:hypothetical protein
MLINSWKQFVYAVAEMRRLQEARGKSAEKGFELLRVQHDVDSAVEKKLAEYGERQGGGA